MGRQTRLSSDVCVCRRLVLPRPPPRRRIARRAPTRNACRRKASRPGPRCRCLRRPCLSPLPEAPRRARRTKPRRPRRRSTHSSHRQAPPHTPPHAHVPRACAARMCVARMCVAHSLHYARSTACACIPQGLRMHSPGLAHAFPRARACIPQGLRMHSPGLAHAFPRACACIPQGQHPPHGVRPSVARAAAPGAGRLFTR